MDMEPNTHYLTTKKPSKYRSIILVDDSMIDSMIDSMNSYTHIPLGKNPINCTKYDATPLKKSGVFLHPVSTVDTVDTSSVDRWIER